MESKLIFKQFDKSYINQLNEWQLQEQNQGNNDIEQFIMFQDSQLGQTLHLISTKTDIKTLLAFDQNNLIGFVCYDQKENGRYFIELMAVNPMFRGQNYSEQIINLLKEELIKKPQFKSLALSVDTKNIRAQKAFDKFAKNKNLNNNQYIEYDL